MCVGEICSSRLARRDVDDEVRSRFDRVAAPLREPFAALAQALGDRLETGDRPASFGQLLREDPQLAEDLLAALGRCDARATEQAAHALAGAFSEMCGQYGMSRDPGEIQDQVVDSLRAFVSDSVNASAVRVVERQLDLFCDQADRLARDPATARATLDHLLLMRERALDGRAGAEVVGEAFIDSLATLGLDPGRARYWETAARGGIGEAERWLLAAEIAQGARGAAREARAVIGSEVAELARSSPSVFFEIFDPAVRRGAEQLGVAVSTSATPCNESFASHAYAETIEAASRRQANGEQAVRVTLYLASASALLVPAAAPAAVLLSLGVSLAVHVSSSLAQDAMGRERQIDLAAIGERAGVTAEGTAGALRGERYINWGAGFLAAATGGLPGVGGVVSSAVAGEAVARAGAWYRSSHAEQARPEPERCAPTMNRRLFLPRM